MLDACLTFNEMATGCKWICHFILLVAVPGSAICFTSSPTFAMISFLNFKIGISFSFCVFLMANMLNICSYPYLLSVYLYIHWLRVKPFSPSLTRFCFNYY